MKIVASIYLLTFLSVISFGQNKDNGQPLIDKFFETYKSKGHHEAISYAFGTMKWIDVNGDEVKNMKFELDKIVNLIGNYIGHEEANSKMAGSRFRCTSYFAYYDRQPLRFTFMLYKNNDGWMIWNLQFDTSYDDELKEAIKLSDKR
jgi:hypothetical protein